MAKRTGSKSKTTDVRLDASMRIVILHGAEEMLKRLKFLELRGALAEAYGEIDPVVFDGNDAPLADVLDELRTFSLIQTHKLVVVDSADVFMTTHREAMGRYAENPVDHGTLVLRSVNWRPGNFDKAVAKVGAKVTCTPLSGAEASRWLVSRCQQAYSRKLTREGAEALVARLGSDLMRLDSELGKLALMAGEDESIDVAMVEQLVGRASDELAWVVQESVLGALAAAGDRPSGGGRRGGAMVAGALIEKVHELVDLSGQSEVLVSYAVMDVVRKLHLGLMMKQQGENDAQIGRQLKLFGPRQTLFMQAMRRLRPEAGMKLFHDAVMMDRRGKSGLGKTLANLECFCARLADKVQ